MVGRGGAGRGGKGKGKGKWTDSQEWISYHRDDGQKGWITPTELARAERHLGLMKSEEGKKGKGGGRGRRDGGKGDWDD